MYTKITDGLSSEFFENSKKIRPIAIFAKTYRVSIALVSVAISCTESQRCALPEQPTGSEGVDKRGERSAPAHTSTRTTAGTYSLLPERCLQGEEEVRTSEPVHGESTAGGQYVSVGLL